MVTNKLYKCTYCQSEFDDLNAANRHHNREHLMLAKDLKQFDGDSWQAVLYDHPKPPSPPPAPDTGRKDDSDKNRMELIPPELLFAVGDVLTFGAAKYADRNWEAGLKWSRVFGALMRHMWAWWSGQSNDAETGKSHLWHAACCIAFLIAYEQRQTGTDDRPTTPKEPAPRD